MRLLILEPIGGLGNRMRAIDSGVVLAKEINARLRVVWRLDQHLAAPFDSLFDRPACIDEFAEVDIMTCEPDAFNAAMRAYALSLGPDNFLDRPRAENLAADAIRRMGLGHNAVLYLRTWDSFRANEKPFSIFLPVAGIRSEIDRTVARFDETIGVHIRRTDNAKSIAVSSTELFIARMASALDRGEARSFFLATDDRSEQSAVEERLPGAILGHPKRSLDRSEPAAAADAVIDLFCLARTKRLFGSHFSSFSTVAASLGAIPFETIGGEVT